MSTPQHIDKIRYERLKLVCRKALEQAIKKSLSMESLESCYPNLAKLPVGLKSLQTARQQVIQFWHTNSLSEFDLIFAERDVEQKLNDLDEIIQTAQHRKAEGIESPVHFDKLTSDEMMESTLSNYSQESIDNLTMIHSQLSLENAELYQKLKGLADTGNDLKSDIESSLKTLQKEVETLDSEVEKLQLTKLIDNLLAET